MNYQLNLVLMCSVQRRVQIPKQLHHFLSIRRRQQQRFLKLLKNLINNIRISQAKLPPFSTSQNVTSTAHIIMTTTSLEYVNSTVFQANQEPNAQGAPLNKFFTKIFTSAYSSEIH